MSPGDVEKLLALESDAAEIHVITAAMVQNFSPGILERVLCYIGADSQADYYLPKPVTSLAYIRQGHDLVILTRNKRIQAFCKLGVKHLFQYLNAEPKELCALCVLDIFVYEQRSGTGSLLIDVLQQLYGTDFGDMAVDRPSAKMGGFLAKKWGGYNDQQNSQFAMRDDAIARLSEAFKRAKFQASRGGKPFDYMQLSIRQYAALFGGKTPEKQRYVLAELLPQTSPGAAPAYGRYQSEPELERSIVEEYLQARRERTEDPRAQPGSRNRCSEPCKNECDGERACYKGSSADVKQPYKEPQKQLQGAQPPASRSSIRVRPYPKTGFW